jgi:hypothetical protein
MARSAAKSLVLDGIPARHRAQAALVANVADAAEALRVPALPRAARLHLLALVERADQIGTGVPVSLAARMLGVTMPTVRTWIARGVLEPVPEARPAVVTTRSLGEALAAASQIRAAGKDERLLRRVVDELADRRTRGELDDRIGELDTRTPIDPDRVAEELFA